MTNKPLHISISEQIKEDIQNKKYIHKLPNERDLAGYYNVSRTTLGKALSQLAKEGLIFQKQGSGSYINSIFVEGKNDYSGYSTGPVGLTKSGDGQHKITSTIHNFTVVKASEELASRLQIIPGTFLYHILRSRSSENVTISLEELYIPIQIIPNLSEDIFTNSFYDYVRSTLKLNLKKSFYNISIISPDEDTATILKTSTHDKIVKIDELVFQDNGQPFQISIVYMLTDYFSYNGISELD